MILTTVYAQSVGRYLIMMMVIITTEIEVTGSIIVVNVGGSIGTWLGGIIGM